MAVSDASPGKMPRQGSQGGMFLLVSTPDIVSKRVPAACLFWLSHRLKRVARSSMATESMALCEATEHAEFLRACLCEVLVSEKGTYDQTPQKGKPWKCLLPEEPTYD